MRKAEVHVQLKPGIIGVRVKLMPPDVQFPDKIQIVSELPPSEEKAEKPPDEILKEMPDEIPKGDNLRNGQNEEANE